MPQRILIIGAGFAGLWSALGAARLLDAQQRQDVRISLIAPRPELVLRPRLHEAHPAGMTTPLLPLFDATGIEFIAGQVRSIDSAERRVYAEDADGAPLQLDYDRLVLASGSQLAQPPLPGLVEHALNIDQLDGACALQAHLEGLAGQPVDVARNTVVVGGGGFTGIELAAELPARLRGLFGEGTPLRVVLVERAAEIGPDLGPGPRPQIQTALAELGVECRLGVGVARVEANAVTLDSGERIATRTLIWTAGVQAQPLARALSPAHDAQGRLAVEDDLRVPDLDGVFAAGDLARARTDDAGHYSLMACQHAMKMGRVAGYNVAADLLGLPTLPYRQVAYVTCLDLGPWGALFTEGWEREVRLQGAEAKTLKRQINGEWIYPPRADRAAAFAAADPALEVVA